MHVIGRLLQTKASSTSAGEAISLDAAEVTFGGSTAVVRGQRVEGTAVGVRSRTISLDRDTVAVLRGHCGQNEQEQRFRCSGLVVRGGPNRRPSAFQELYRPSGQKRESPCCPAHRRLRWPAGFSAIISTVPGYRRVPFCPWDSCGITARTRSCWDSAGAGRRRMLSPAPSATPTAEVHSITHRDEGRGQVRPDRLIHG